MRIVVSGTGTNVGKTWVARTVAQRLRHAGFGCLAIKPIESGGAADSEALAAACSNQRASALYRFDQAVGPHLAAERAGIEIDLDACVAWVLRQGHTEDVVIVELAGGLLSPLGAQQTNADLLCKLRPNQWIAVAPDRLGVLHDLKALMLCVRHLDLADPVVVLNEPEYADASTGTNERSLRSTGTCEVSARFLRGAGAAAENEGAAARLIRALGLTSQAGARQP